VAGKFRERLSVSKRAVQKFDMERFNPKKVNDMKVKEQYQVKISTIFAALENVVVVVVEEEEEEEEEENIVTKSFVTCSFQIVLVKYIYQGGLCEWNMSCT
jgi:hypothetical protein